MNADAGGARILDRGYQHYQGERQGLAAALWSIMAGTMRRSLGFKRPTSAKILPFLIILLAMAPAIIVLGVRVILPVSAFGSRALDRLITYPDYFNLLSTELLLMAALAAPEALCPDRRQRVLSLYYASPVSPSLYLLAQAAAVTLIMLLITTVPELFLWIGNVGLATDPGAYFSANADQAVRILASGTLLALYYAGLGLLVSSSTDRKGYAAGVIIAGSVILGVATSIVRTSVHSGWARYAILVDPVNLPRRALRAIFGLTDPGTGVQGWVYLVAAAATILISFMLLVRAYRAIRF